MPRGPLLLAFPLLCGLPALAQWETPTIGMVFSPAARTVHTIQGVPGAAILSGPLLRDIDRAWVAPSGRFALVQAGDALVLADARARIGAPLLLAHPREAITAVRWSWDEQRIGIAYSSCSCIQIQRLIQPLEAAPEGAELLLPSGDAFVDFALTLHARVIIASTSSAVYRLGPGREPLRIVDTSARLDLLADHRLVAVSPETASLRMITVSDDAETAEPALPLSLEPGETVTGLLGDASHSRILVSTDRNRLLHLSTETGQVLDSISTEGPVSRAQRLAGHLLLWTAEELHGPIRLAGAAAASLTFVPAREK